MTGGSANPSSLHAFSNSFSLTRPSPETFPFERQRQYISFYWLKYSIVGTKNLTKICHFHTTYIDSSSGCAVTNKTFFFSHNIPCLHRCTFELQNTFIRIQPGSRRAVRMTTVQNVCHSHGPHSSGVTFMMCWNMLFKFINKRE